MNQKYNNFKDFIVDLTLKYETLKIKNLKMYNGLIFKKENC